MLTYFGVAFLCSVSWLSVCRAVELTGGLLSFFSAFWIVGREQFYMRLNEPRFSRQSFLPILSIPSLPSRFTGAIGAVQRLSGSPKRAGVDLQAQRLRATCLLSMELPIPCAFFIESRLFSLPPSPLCRQSICLDLLLSTVSVQKRQERAHFTRLSCPVHGNQPYRMCYYYGSPVTLPEHCNLQWSIVKKEPCQPLYYHPSVTPVCPHKKVAWASVW